MASPAPIDQTPVYRSPCRAKPPIGQRSPGDRGFSRRRPSPRSRSCSSSSPDAATARVRCGTSSGVPTGDGSIRSFCALLETVRGQWRDWSTAAASPAHSGQRRCSPGLCAAASSCPCRTGPTSTGRRTSSMPAKASSSISACAIMSATLASAPWTRSPGNSRHSSLPSPADRGFTTSCGWTCFQT